MLMYDFRSSGVVRNVIRIAAAAQHAGLEVEIWVVRRQGDLLATVPPNIPVVALAQGPAIGPRALDSMMTVGRLAHAITSRRPAILFSGGNHSHLYAALGLLISGKRRALRFVGRASNAVVSATGGRWRRAIRPFERFQYAVMDRIVAVSDELRGDLASLAPRPSRVSAVPNGIDLAQVERSSPVDVVHPFFAPGAPPLVLGIGRLSRQKNFDGLLRAFAVARQHRPLSLMILGSGPPRAFSRLRSLAAQLGIGDDVVLAGFVPDPVAYLKRADLFVLSSRWEGASNVLLEALASGCPIVATRAPTGVAEVLKHGEVAPIVPVGDERALAGAMLRRLAEHRNAHALRRRASDFDLSRTLSAYVRILSEEYDRAVHVERAALAAPRARNHGEWAGASFPGGRR